MAPTKKLDIKESIATAFMSGTNQPATAQDPEALEVPKGYKLVKESRTVRMQILVDADTKQYLKDKSYKLGLSMNEIINQALEDYIKKNK